MKHTLNWLERRSISQQDVNVQTRLSETGEIELEVVSIALKPPKDPSEAAKWPSARVILSARDKGADADFEKDIGSVADIASAPGSILIETMAGFRNIKSIKFKLLVLGPDKRYLARLDDFPASQDTLSDRDDLFHTRHEDLGERPYLIEVDPVDGVTLVLDTEYARHGLRAVETVGLVLPMVIDVGLTKALQFVSEGSEEDWVERWIRYGELRMGPRPDCDHDDAAMTEWIRKVVTCFASEASCKSTLLNNLSSKD